MNLYLFVQNNPFDGNRYEFAVFENSEYYFVRRILNSTKARWELNRVWFKCTDFFNFPRAYMKDKSFIGIVTYEQFIEKFGTDVMLDLL